MVGTFLLQRRVDFMANVLRFPAARVEIAPGGRIDRAGHIALQDDTLALEFQFGIRHRDS